jgi:Flp pilus assembly protein TadD
VFSDAGLSRDVHEPAERDREGRNGHLLLRRGDKDLAITEYEKAAQINPVDLDSQNNLATAYLEKGRLAESERTFKWILANDAANGAS